MKKVMVLVLVGAAQTIFAMENQRGLTLQKKKEFSKALNGMRQDVEKHGSLIVKTQNASPKKKYSVEVLNAIKRIPLRGRKDEHFIYDFRELEAVIIKKNKETKNLQSPLVVRHPKITIAVSAVVGAAITVAALRCLPIVQKVVCKK